MCIRDSAETTFASVERESAPADDPDVFVREEPAPPVVEAPVVEAPAPPTGDVTRLSFAPSADITLSVVGDGVVLYDGFVGAGTVLGPYDAVGFEIYTSNAGATFITNIATGVTFQFAYDESELFFNLP